MRKVIRLVAVLVVIVGGTSWAILGCRNKLPPVPPIPKTVVEIVDATHFTEVTLTIPIWENELQEMPDTGYRRDAKTGKIYAEKITCASCGKAIPYFSIKGNETARDAAAAYKCPLCGKPAYNLAPEGQ